MYTKILVPLDQSAIAEQAIGPAVAIARAWRASVELVTVHSSDSISALTGVPWDALVEEEEKYLERMAAEVSRGGGVNVSSLVLHGPVAEAICARVTGTGVDLVVMTTHGRTGLGRALLGSVADAVMRRSSVPVLMQRPRVRARNLHVTWPLSRVIVPLDGSELSAQILPAATDLAAVCGAEIVLFRGVRPVPRMRLEPSTMLRTYDIDETATDSALTKAADYLRDVERRIRATGVTAVEAHVVLSDDIVDAILETAGHDDRELIAIATHGRGSSRLLVESIADELLRKSEFPLLVLHPVPATAIADGQSHPTTEADQPVGSTG